ncbi:MAG: lipid A biosynthesis acyltransferase [Betaproteobacteria bacterium]|nr:MAG: lipid A biosynthesis acyltransferase [Betaproteobacteria bacterium]
MLTRIALALMWLLHFLPSTLLASTGELLGLLIMGLVRERRNVVRINLELCFPDLSKAQRKRLARAHFRAFGRALAETTIAWWSDVERVRALATVEGKQHFDVANRAGPVIVLAPHFVGVEILAIRLSIEENAQSMYSRQKNAVFNRFLISRRTRFRPIRLASRQDGIKPLVRGLKARLPLFYLPDMDFGPRDAIFVPFFGVPAATIDAVPRLAALTGAAVVPVLIEQKPAGQGYLIRFLPAWENYPTRDFSADTLRMNRFIEDCVRAAPEQYFWIHKRFKTRPPGEKRVY